MASVLNKLNLNGTEYHLASTAYAVCDDLGDFSAKSVSLEGFTLTTGVTIHVKFTHGCHAWQPTLNVNNTGAKPISCRGFVSSASVAHQICVPGEVVALTYDGSSWQINKNFNLQYVTYLIQKLGDMKNAILRFQEINPDLPSAPNTVTTSFYGAGDAVEATMSNGGKYYFYGGASACRKQSDSSIEAARTGSSTAYLKSGTGQIQIFYYNYTSLAMYFSAAVLTELGLDGRTITGIDLYFSRDPEGYGNNPNVYAGYVEDSSSAAIDPYADYLVASGVCGGEEIDGEYKMHIPFNARPFVAPTGAPPYPDMAFLIEWLPGIWTGGIYMINKITFHYENGWSPAPLTTD